MSVNYWGIKGYGVCIDDIYKYLNKEKVNKLVREAMPNEIIEEDIFEDDTFYGNPYMNFANFLLEFDDKSILTDEDDGQGISYLLYSPPYPWLATKNEPKTKEELEDYIINILQKVYDAKDDELKEYIGYIDSWGGA